MTEMIEETIERDGVSIPGMFYGTAWKEDQTEALVKRALEAGFRAIDTANQRKHYFEDGVGAALESIYKSLEIERGDLFLQTKFTFRAGQDERLPYDPEAPIGEQVHQSFASSLEHLRTDYIDSLVLHGPSQRAGLGEDDRAAWRAMEEVHADGGARFLGVSNVTAEQLATLCEFAEVTPSFVQNRCFARMGWDARVREICGAYGIIYQGFSLLTANAREVSTERIAKIAAARSLTLAQLIFLFARQVGILPLTGTTDGEHMRQDLATLVEAPLEPRELVALLAFDMSP